MRVILFIRYFKSRPVSQKFWSGANSLLVDDPLYSVFWYTIGTGLNILKLIVIRLHSLKNCIIQIFSFMCLHGRVAELVVHYYGISLLPIKVTYLKHSMTKISLIVPFPFFFFK